MSHSPAMLHFSLHREIHSHKSMKFFHIASAQFFPDKSAADLPASIHFFWQDFHIKPIFSAIFFQHLRSSFSFKAKPEILPDSHVGGLKVSYQNFFYKIFCFHMPDPVIQRTFQQNIYAQLL